MKLPEAAACSALNGVQVASSSESLRSRPKKMGGKFRFLCFFTRFFYVKLPGKASSSSSSTSRSAAWIFFEIFSFAFLLEDSRFGKISERQVNA